MRYFREILTDADGIYSSKRTVTLLAFLLLGTAFLANLFWGLQIEEFIFDSMTYIVIGGLGFSTAEPLANALFQKSKHPSATNLQMDSVDVANTA